MFEGLKDFASKLMDIRLPGGNTIDVGRGLKKAPPAAPMIRAFSNPVPRTSVPAAFPEAPAQSGQPIMSFIEQRYPGGVEGWRQFMRENGIEQEPQPFFPNVFPGQAFDGGIELIGDGLEDFASRLGGIRERIGR